MTENTKHTPGTWRADSELVFCEKEDGFGHPYAICGNGGAFSPTAGFIGHIEDNPDGELPGAYVVSDAQHEEALANFRLLAAAPALLDACERAAEGYQTMIGLLDRLLPTWRTGYSFGEGLQQIITAIRRAKENPNDQEEDTDTR